MPVKRKLKTYVRLLRGDPWRRIVKSFASWLRHQLGLLIVVTTACWLLGSVALFLVERGVNPAYETFFDALWNVWLIFFTGLEDAPETFFGRLLSMLLIIVGVALVGLYTAILASMLVERFLRRRQVSEFEMDDHLVLCNWDPRGLDWIREVHSRIVQERKRPVVIIHDKPEEIDLPDKQEDAAFSDVYIVKGDPTNDVVLRRAKVQRAYSVVVLADDREGKHADGKTILTCIAIRGLSKNQEGPNIAVECRSTSNVNNLRRAGADEIISADEMGLRMLARASLFHGMTRVYHELLTVGRDSNELFVIPIPEALIGREFSDLSALFARRRDDRLSCLLVGIQRDDEMILNPIGEEAGPLKADDHLILLSRVYPGANQALPLAKAEE